MRLRRVPVTLDEGVLAQQALDVCALYTLTPSVNQPDIRETGLGRGVEIFIDDRNYVARCEAVEIDRVLDRNVYGFVVFRCQLVNW